MVKMKKQFYMSFILIFFSSILVAQDRLDSVDHYRKIVMGYNKECDKLKKVAFCELRRLDKSREKPKWNEFNRYQFVIKLIYPYITQGIDSFEKGIDFTRTWRNYEIYVFKDSECLGYLFLSEHDKFFFSTNDSNRASKRVANLDCKLANQIIYFKPDMVFKLEMLNLYVFFVKNNKLYVAKTENHLNRAEFLSGIQPFKDYVKNDTCLIKELLKHRRNTLTNYKILH